MGVKYSRDRRRYVTSKGDVRQYGRLSLRQTFLFKFVSSRNVRHLNYFSIILNETIVTGIREFAQAIRDSVLGHPPPPLSTSCSLRTTRFCATSPTV